MLAKGTLPGEELAPLRPLEWSHDVKDGDRERAGPPAGSGPPAPASPSAMAGTRGVDVFTLEGCGAPCAGRTTLFINLCGVMERIDEQARGLRGCSTHTPCPLIFPRLLSHTSCASVAESLMCTGPTAHTSPCLPLIPGPAAAAGVVQLCGRCLPCHPPPAGPPHLQPSRRPGALLALSRPGRALAQ